MQAQGERGLRSALDTCVVWGLVSAYTYSQMSSGGCFSQGAQDEVALIAKMPAPLVTATSSSASFVKRVCQVGAGAGPEPAGASRRARPSASGSCTSSANIRATLRYRSVPGHEGEN